MIVIHHGSGVEPALAEILEGRNLVKPPYRDLKTEEVKDLIKAYSQIWPIANSTLVAGPLDEANPSVLDKLLKRIEEPVKGAPELILWANDYGGVPSTIRSRCGEKYHYQFIPQHRLYDQAEELLESILERDLVKLSDVLRVISKGDYRGFFEAYAEVILDKGLLKLYDSGLKDILRRGRVSQVALYGYFMRFFR